MSLLLSSVAASVVSLSGGAAEVPDGISPNVVTLRFETYGLITGLTDFVSDKWYELASAAGIGANYEILATRVSGAVPTGTALDTWSSLSTARSWSLTQIGVGSKTTTLLIKIRPNGGAVVAQGTYTITAGVL